MSPWRQPADAGVGISAAGYAIHVENRREDIMSVTDPGRGTTRAATPEVRGRTADSFERPRRVWQETKPSFMTTEFWGALAGIAALIVIYNLTDNPSLTLWRTALLCTALGAAYIISRGWAKAGSHDDRWMMMDRDRNDRDRYDRDRESQRF
jgi:hypothetical protein